jgi:hypothetical protein
MRGNIKTIDVAVQITVADLIILKPFEKSKTKLYVEYIFCSLKYFPISEKTTSKFDFGEYDTYIGILIMSICYEKM